MEKMKNIEQAIQILNSKLPQDILDDTNFRFSVKPDGDNYKILFEDLIVTYIDEHTPNHVPSIISEIKDGVELCKNILSRVFDSMNFQIFHRRK